MKVIKVVKREYDGKLVSTFAKGVWEKEYANGVKVKPDKGYLFAYPRRNLQRARDDFGAFAFSDGFRFWEAEAEVAGKIHLDGFDLWQGKWSGFWRAFKLRKRLPRAEYLLCSSITLIKEIPNDKKA